MDKSAGRVRANQVLEKKKLPVFVVYGIIAAAVLAAVVIGLVIYLSVEGGYVATVDGVKIGTGEFKYYLEVEKQSMYQSALSADPNLNEATFWNTPIGGTKAIDVAKKKALESLRAVKIQYIKAKENKVKLDADEIKNIDQGIEENIIKNYGGTKIQANNQLRSEYGFSIDDIRNAQIEQTTVSKFQYGEMDKIKVEESDIKSYYDKNPDWYKTSSMRSAGEEAVWVRHILIKAASDAKQEDKDAARKKAEEVLSKAKAGEDFTTLAKQNSEDGNAQYGGSYVFTKGVMAKEFEDASFSLSPGQIYDTPVQTEYGYHIIKLEEKIAKDQPVSLKCATEHYEYGVGFIKYQLYNQQLENWKKDAKYNPKMNDKVYNSIT